MEKSFIIIRKQTHHKPSFQCQSHQVVGGGEKGTPHEDFGAPEAAIDLTPDSKMAASIVAIGRVGKQEYRTHKVQNALVDDELVGQFTAQRLGLGHDVDHEEIATNANARNTKDKT